MNDKQNIETVSFRTEFINIRRPSGPSNIGGNQLFATGSTGTQQPIQPLAQQNILLTAQPTQRYTEVSLQYIDATQLLISNKPSVDIGTSYSALIENKNDLVSINKDVIKKVEIICVNLIYAGNKDYNNLQTNSEIFKLNQEDTSFYKGPYHFVASSKQFKTGQFASTNSKELIFQYEYKIDYSAVSTLFNTNDELVRINNQINSNVNTISFEMSKYLNFLVGFEKTLNNFYGMDLEKNASYIKNLIESNLILQKYRSEVNVETLITQFNINGLSQSALGNVYYDFYNNYKSFIIEILRTIPQGDAIDSIKGKSNKYKPDYGNYYVIDSINGDNLENYFKNKEYSYRTLFDYGVKFLNSDTLTKFKNILSIMIGTYDYNSSNLADVNYKKVLAFDFIINTFLKTYKDLIDKQRYVANAGIYMNNNINYNIMLYENPNISDEEKIKIKYAIDAQQMFPVEYLVNRFVVKGTDTKNAYQLTIEGLTELETKINDILTTDTAYLNSISEKEKRIFEKSIIGGVILNLKTYISEMLKNFKNISAIVEVLATATKYDINDTYVKTYFEKIDNYKWYNDTNLSDVVAILNTNIDVFRFVKSIDKLNWPASKTITEKPGFYIAPSMTYYLINASNAGPRKAFQLGTRIYIPPFGWKVDRFVFGLFKADVDGKSEPYAKDDKFGELEGDGRTIPYDSVNGGSGGAENGKYWLAQPGENLGNGQINPNIYTKDNAGNNQIIIPFTEYVSAQFQIQNDERPMTRISFGDRNGKNSSKRINSYARLECTKIETGEQYKFLFILTNFGFG